MFFKNYNNLFSAGEENIQHLISLDDSSSKLLLRICSMESINQYTYNNTIIPSLGLSHLGLGAFHFFWLDEASLICGTAHRFTYTYMWQVRFITSSVKAWLRFASFLWGIRLFERRHSIAVTYIMCSLNYGCRKSCNSLAATVRTQCLISHTASACSGHYKNDRLEYIKWPTVILFILCCDLKGMVVF